MADLKKDLDEYLLLQSDQKKNFKLTIPAIPFQKPSLPGWFRRDQTPTDSDSWYQETKREYCPSLSKFQRLALFALCVGMGILCFTISLMYLPVLLFKARKFALLFTLGSLFFVFSLFFLWGPLTYIKHMFSRERLGLTLSYGGTLFGTLYCALYLQSTPFTVVFAVGQIISLLWTVITNIPGGVTGLSFISKMFSRSVSGSNVLPI
ncbi:hypothetical protein ABEB36_014722 [Hypothenemus hampei]|uniref:Vesicle transport protein n=1 Tax=Hypothenemus hampei TaxID=57062 RepID=A0ABD1E799_HYPHA